MFSIDGGLTTKTINGVANVVTQVSWVYTKQLGESKMMVKGKTDLSYDPSAPFTNYADLTEATVVGWIESSLGAEGVAYYDNVATSQYATIMAKWPDDPIKEMTLFPPPYSSEAETETEVPWA